MKKFITLLLCAPSLLFAQQYDIQQRSFQSPCLSSQQLTELVDEFEEVAFVRGLSQTVDAGKFNPVVVFVNPDTKSYTIAQKQESDLYCILAVGHSFQPVPKDIQDEARQRHKKGTM